MNEEIELSEFKAIYSNGKEYISLDDLLNYFKDAQKQFPKKEKGFEIFQQLIKNFVWLKNNLKGSAPKPSPTPPAK